jgi:hypothetical protein
VAIAAAVDAEFPWFTAGPRGICFPVRKRGPGRCLGGIASPGEALIAPRTGPGDDASGCAMHGDGVVCWGEAYSPPGAPARPVPITFATSRSAADYAAVDFGTPAEWAADCLINAGCEHPTPPLPACSAMKARDWSSVWAQAPTTLVGKVVALRGPLGVGPGRTTLMGCGVRAGRRGCCNGTGGDLWLGGALQGIALDGFHCRGDDSRACCNAPAYGQTVVATGQLTTERGQWRLLKASLCVEAGQPAK